MEPEPTPDARVLERESAQFVARVATAYDHDLVRFIGKRLRTSADARDIAQEAYIRLLRLDRKDLIRDPGPYLYRIAANLMYEAELKRRADASGIGRWSSDLLAEAEAGYEEPGAEVLELRRELIRVLELLTPKCRAVLVMHRRERMTYDEIAAKLGISSSMVKKYLAQGLKVCREQLKEYRQAPP